MRRPIKNRNIAGPDLVYKNDKIGKLINYVMLSGKKNTARTVVYAAVDQIKEIAKVENPVEILETALKNVCPLMEVRSRRVGGANYQVPREVRPERQLALGMKWIIEAARGKKGKPMHMKLAEEIIGASKNEGEAVKKRENTHKMAEANKAFAHFAW
ncbi:MAG: 30S ribosomal protein S7 [Candidatus Taylorbacteria bacterium]|nr:30S ribosomal protein S7 [Candidatus Taylorbacteria bacterium]